MNWLTDYQDDIVAMEESRGNAIPIDIDDDEQVQNFVKDFEGIFSPLKDGRLDSGDLESIFNLWWQKFYKLEIQMTRKEVAILVKLAPLFKKMSESPDTEFEEFVKFRLHARMQSKVFVQLMRMYAKSYSR